MRRVKEYRVESFDGDEVYTGTSTELAKQLNLEPYMICNASYYGQRLCGIYRVEVIGKKEVFCKSDKKPKQKEKKKTLDDIAREAREMGMTYGMYQAYLQGTIRNEV